jgi:hypothetical protein
VIDDAAPVATGQLEFELGVAHTRPHGSGRDHAGPVMALTYGVISGLDLGIALQRVNQDLQGSPPLKGFEDLHLATKYRFIGEQAYIAALTFAIDVKVPTANRRNRLSTGKFDEDIMAILSKTYTPISLHINLGYLIVDSPREAKLKNHHHGGIAAECPFRSQWVLVGEIRSRSREASVSKNQADFLMGLRYSLTPRLGIDTAAGRSLLAAGTSIQGTVGFTWTIDALKLINPQPARSSWFLH